MQNKSIIAWIFTAIAIASQNKPADIRMISSIADGINHAIPSPKELKLSIDWLLRNKLISEMQGKFHLTKNGIITFGFASLKTPYAFETWKNVERQFIRMG